MFWVHFWRNVWKIFKNEDIGFYIFEKGHILRPFSGLAPSKLIMVAYVHIEYSTYHFLRYQKKRGPERVKCAPISEFPSNIIIPWMNVLMYVAHKETYVSISFLCIISYVLTVSLDKISSLLFSKKTTKMKRFIPFF